MRKTFSKIVQKKKMRIISHIVFLKKVFSFIHSKMAKKQNIFHLLHNRRVCEFQEYAKLCK